MCLAVPGKILSISNDGPLRLGKVDFGGVRRNVGDYVLVHVGFAISTIDEAEAHATLETLAELAEAINSAAG